MITLPGMDLKNVLTIKEASVDFDPGLTYITGINKDSDPDNPTSNGAGKTLLMSAFPNVVYFTNPMALKKKQKKDILGKGSSINFLIERPEGTFEIEQTATKYKIFKNGEDIQIRTVTLAEEYIRKLFPISEVEFYSRIYVTTQKPYPLQYASDTDRLEAFSTIFNLDQHQILKSHFLMKQREIKDNETKIAVLEQNAIQLRRKIEELQCDVTESEYKKLAIRVKRISELLRTKATELHELQTLYSSLEVLKQLETKLDKFRLRYAEHEIELPPKEFLDTLKNMRIAARAWSDYALSSKQYRRDKARLLDKLQTLTKPDRAVSDIAEEVSTQANLVEEAQEHLRKQEKTKTRFDELSKEIVSHEKQLKQFDRYVMEDSDRDDLAQARTVLKLEKLLHEHDSDGKCPTCMSDVDIAGIKKLVKNAKAKIEELKKVSEGAKIHENLKLLQDELIGLLFKGGNVEGAEKDLRIKRKKLIRLQAELDNASAYSKLNKQLKELEAEAPSEPEYHKPEYDEAKIDAYIDLCNSILKLVSQRKVLLRQHPELDLRSSEAVVEFIESTGEKIKRLEEESESLSDKQASASEKVMAYDSFTKHSGVLGTELAETEEKIEQLKPSIRNKKILDILIKAYGSKGLRSIVAQDICRLYEQNLNEYAQLTFAEPFVFYVEAYEGGISIKAETKDKAPYDIRTLSGAEANSFALASAAALEAMTPDNKRCSLKIFDEPTNHMCPISKANVLERFIPLMRETVPSVVIITNYQDEIAEDSNVWKIIKENGVSTLHKER